METLAAQPLREAESINHYERTYNDTTTWLAEVLDGSMRSTFEFSFDGQDLVASDGGKLDQIFEDAIVDARRIANRNPSMGFELRRRLIEAEEYRVMLAMARGEAANTLVVVSDFPPELMSAKVDTGGYNVQRKQTMLRVISWDGAKLSMQTQSLDHSNRTALEGIYRDLGVEPKAGELLGQRIELNTDRGDQPYVIDRLTATYDDLMRQQFGGDWYAGRHGGRQNTLDFVRKQHFVVENFVRKQLAGEATERDAYNAAALLTEFMQERKDIPSDVYIGQAILSSNPVHLESQLALAGERAITAGKTFSGCGGSIGPGGTSATEQLDQAGYGNSFSAEEDDYGPLTFKCKNGHTNRRPRGKLIKQCRVSNCKNSVAC